MTRGWVSGSMLLLHRFVYCSVSQHAYKIIDFRMTPKIDSGLFSDLSVYSIVSIHLITGN